MIDSQQYPDIEPTTVKTATVMVKKVGVRTGDSGMVDDIALKSAINPCSRSSKNSHTC